MIIDVVIMAGVFHTSLICDVVTQNGFFCGICHRMLKDRKAVLQHINVDTHIGWIEVCILIRYNSRTSLMCGVYEKVSSLKLRRPVLIIIITIIALVVVHRKCSRVYFSSLCMTSIF